MGFEAPHHKRVFDAIRPGRPTTSSPPRPMWTIVGGVDLFKEPGHRLRRPGQQPGVPGRRRAYSRPAHTHRRHLVRHARHGRPPHRASRIPGVPMRQAEPVPDVTFDDTAADSTSDGLRIAADRRGGRDDRQRDRLAPRAADRAGQQPLRSPLPALPQPQYAPGRPLPIRRALPAKRPHGPRAAARRAHHRAPRADQSAPG